MSSDGSYHRKRREEFTAAYNADPLKCENCAKPIPIPDGPEYRKVLTFHYCGPECQAVGRRKRGQRTRKANSAKRKAGLLDES